MSSWVSVLLVLCFCDRPVAGQYCMDQIRILEASARKSITIPCSFSFPENNSDVKSFIFLLKAASQNYCGKDHSHVIYNSTSVTSTRYTGRLNVTVDLNSRKASITITNVTQEDATNYCCRVEFTYLISKTEMWQHPEGTFLKVKDNNEPRLNLQPAIFALAGDNVTILSRLKKKNSAAVNITGCYVGTIQDIFSECDVSTDIGNCTFEKNTLSFNINQVTRLHNGYYCWKVNISNERTPYSYLGPELQILDSSNTLSISQPEETPFSSSTIINCSFTIQEEKRILKTEVYWMIGDPRTSFVYHPDADYIHPDYRGKTSLVDGRHLLLNEFHGSDNTTFYCRVLLRHCLGAVNNIASVLEEGPGTRLRVISEDTQQENQLIIAFCVGLVGLILLVLLLFFLVKARANKKKSSGDHHTNLAAAENKNGGYDNPGMAENQSENLVYATVNHIASAGKKKPKKQQGPSSEDVGVTGEDVLYATVNHSARSANKKSKKPQEPDADIVYAEVKK